MNTTWNCRATPSPIGAAVLFIGQDGRVHQGEVIAHRVIWVTGMKSLGCQYKCVVAHRGRLIAPPMLVPTIDQIGCKAIYRESWQLLEGVPQ